LYTTTTTTTMLSPASWILLFVKVRGHEH